VDDFQGCEAYERVYREGYEIDHVLAWRKLHLPPLYANGFG